MAAPGGLAVAGPSGCGRRGSGRGPLAGAARGPGKDRMEPVLRVRQLYRSYRVDTEELLVLKDVGLEVGRGDFVAVMGQSGSGKSTLLHVVAGLMPPTGGQVFVDGDEVTRMDEAERARLRQEKIGLVFQNFNLMPQLTAEENVGLPLRVAGIDPERESARIEELMRRMDVWKRRGHRPSQMSGGELQRVSIARALVARPPLVLADEPTGNLPRRTGEDVLKLLRETAGAEGSAVLLVTHNPFDAARADRVRFLKDGVLDPENDVKGGGDDAARVLDRLKELGI